MELILFYKSFFHPSGQIMSDYRETVVYFYFVSLACYFNVCLQEAVILNYTKNRRRRTNPENIARWRNRRTATVLDSH